MRVVQKKEYVARVIDFRRTSCRRNFRYGAYRKVVSRSHVGIVRKKDGRTSVENDAFESVASSPSRRNYAFVSSVVTASGSVDKRRISGNLFYLGIRQDSVEYRHFVYRYGRGVLIETENVITDSDSSSAEQVLGPVSTGSSGSDEIPVDITANGASVIGDGVMVPRTGSSVERDGRTLPSDVRTKTYERNGGIVLIERYSVNDPCDVRRFP